MHSLSLILAAAAIGLGLSVVDRPVTENATYRSHAAHQTALLGN